MFCCVAADRCFVRHVSGRQGRDLQRRKMLPSIGRLFDRDSGFAFDEKAVEIFPQQERRSPRKRPHDADFDRFASRRRMPRARSSKTGIGVKDEKPCFHKGRRFELEKSRNLARYAARSLAAILFPPGRRGGGSAKSSGATSCAVRKCTLATSRNASGPSFSTIFRAVSLTDPETPRPSAQPSPFPCPLQPIDKCFPRQNRRRRDRDIRFRSASAVR